LNPESGHYFTFFFVNGTVVPEDEIKQLRKEVSRLRQEREILKKAAAYFAKHQA